MAADKLDYASVISDIRAKIAALQAILTSVESAADARCSRPIS